MAVNKPVWRDFLAKSGYGLETPMGSPRKIVGYVRGILHLKILKFGQFWAARNNTKNIQKPILRTKKIKKYIILYF